MNFVDAIIIILVLLAVVRGLQTGLLTLILSSLGFIAGLLLGSWIARQVVTLLSGPLSKLIVTVVIVFGLALILGGIGEYFGTRLSIKAIRLHLGRANRILGAVLEVLFTVFIIWLIASALTNVRAANIGYNVKNSLIIRGLDSGLPSPPNIFARLETIISPNGFPNVFLGLEPQHTTVSPHNHVNNQAVLKDENSTVKVQGAGCGGIVDGSGFVVAKDIVVTNAHVVAGIARPQVVDRFRTYSATPIWFDPNMDIAVLRVNGLPDQPLKLANQILPDNDAAAVLGFPGGGPLVAENAVIIDHVTAVGRNIYNQGVVRRDIYEVQADVEPGNSGGPLVGPNGLVAGVVFAKSVSQDNVGYALLIDQVKPIIAKAEQRNTPVGTGSCAQ